MIKNEPSDRRDRQIQRRKLRGMWRSLREEEARIEAIPCTRRSDVNYGTGVSTRRPDVIDVTEAFNCAALAAILLFTLVMSILVYS